MLERRAKRRTADGFEQPSRRLPSTVAHISGLALLAITPGLVLSAIVEFIGAGDAGWMILVCAVIFASLGMALYRGCLLYTSPSPRDQRGSRMPSSA